MIGYMITREIESSMDLTSCAEQHKEHSKSSIG